MLKGLQYFQQRPKMLGSSMGNGFQTNKFSVRPLHTSLERVTSNKKLIDFVKDKVSLVKPSSVFVCDGSEAEAQVL